MAQIGRSCQHVKDCVLRWSRHALRFRSTRVQMASFCSMMGSGPAKLEPSRSKKSKFGFLLDIDGVLVRGRDVIPGAREALQKLQDFDIPTLFLTNGGCERESDISERLSLRTGIKILPEQVILSHTPMKMLDSLHDEHVLLVGQGPVKEIAQGYGFNNVSDIEDIRSAYPLLDMIDRSRRYKMENGLQKDFSPVKAMIMMGEPVRWETNFQLVIDLILTNGKPSISGPPVSPDDQLPVIAANTDLLWMAEALLPRFGHGAFLHCLESLYKKLTGKDLIYTMLLGKPYLPTYQFAEQCFQEMNGPDCTVENVYVVGDNLDADVYGANLCDHYLQIAGAHSGTDTLKNFCSQTKQSVTDWLPVTKKMRSILVRTGVSCTEQKPSNDTGQFLHKDAVYNQDYRNPNYVVENIHNAIELVFDLEGLS